MNNKTLNDPNKSLNEVIIEFVNKHSAALADGDIVHKDFTNIAAATAADTWTAPEHATVSSSAYAQTILGVVRDRSGAGVAVGAVGEAIIRGFHPAVKVHSSTTTTVGGVLVQSASNLKAKQISAAASVGTGATLGNALKARSASSTVALTIPVYVDVG